MPCCCDMCFLPRNTSLNKHAGPRYFTLFLFSVVKFISTFQALHYTVSFLFTSFGITSYINYILLCNELPKHRVQNSESLQTAGQYFFMKIKTLLSLYYETVLFHYFVFKHCEGRRMTEIIRLIINEFIKNMKIFSRNYTTGIHVTFNRIKQVHCVELQRLL